MHIFEKSFSALGGVNQVKLCTETSSEAEKLFAQIENEVLRIEHKFSRYRSDSIISQINSAAGSRVLQVDAETAALLDYADTIYRESSGLFDVTSGVLRKAWDFKRGVIPSDSEISELLPLVGWRKVEWKKPSFRLALPGMELDFGGFGKEYAVDRAASIALSSGASSGFINLGGDVRVLGPRPDGTPWVVGIQHPRKMGALLSSIALHSGALATSGDYERYFEIDGQRYCHILNPKTGWPVTELQSVSVVADSSIVAGSYSTITMLLGGSKGKEYLTQSKLPFLMLDQHQNVHSHRF